MGYGDLFSWCITKARSVNGGPIPRGFRPFVQEVLKLASGMGTRQRLTVLTGDKLRRFLMEGRLSERTPAR